MFKKHGPVKLPTRYGGFDVVGYSTESATHLVLFFNVEDLSNILVRVHSSCRFGEVFHSLDCECGPQLWKAMKLISEEGAGIIIYLDQEGRGAGIERKLDAMNLEQTKEMDTVEAFHALGMGADLRDYDTAIRILQDLEIKDVRLLTNNPKKVEALKSARIKTERIPLIIEPTEYSKDYLETKRDKFGHCLQVFRNEIMGHSDKDDELVVPFMVAEFETLTGRILNIEQTRATRINFYIVIVSAAIGGLSLATQFQLTASINPATVPILSFIVFLLGIAILNENVELASQAVFLYRRAGRVRCWFQDKNPKILPYLAWTPGDDTPPFRDEPGHGTFAGKDSILWLGNSISGAIIILSILISCTRLLIIASCIISAIVFLIIWIAQNKYIEYLMDKYEQLGSEKGRIHFPRSERTYKVD